jgi:hypothetical protein
MPSCILFSTYDAYLLSFSLSFLFIHPQCATQCVSSQTQGHYGYLHFVYSWRSFYYSDDSRRDIGYPIRRNATSSH